MSNLSKIISLQEPVGLIKETFREEVLLRVKRGGLAAMGDDRVSELVAFNCVPYMQLLLKEMFSKARPPADFVDASTQLLINAGLAKDVATSLSCSVFSYTVDCIAPHFPNLTFETSDDYLIDFCGECDVVIREHDCN
jgi:hypothetical protein